MPPASTGRADPARPAVAVALAEPEQTQILAALGAAGFETVPLGGESSLHEAFPGRAERIVAIVDVAGDPAGTVARVATARTGRPEALSVVYIVGGGELDALEAAGLDPADEILIRPFEVDALRWRVEAMAIRAQVPVTEGADPVLAGGGIATELAPTAPVFAVFNPKGGVGKTTIATNLAAVLQQWKGLQVLLVDGDTVTGHVGLSLGLTTERSAAEAWVAEDAGYGHAGLLHLAVRHDSGIHVVALSTNPLSHASLDPARVADSIREARDAVDAIVVDLHPSYNEVNLAIFAIADRILVPVTPDLPAMRAAIQLKDVAAEVGVRDRLAMIINRANSGVSVADMEATVGLPVVAQIRSAGMHFVWAANAGRSVIEKFPKHGVAQDLERLADRVLATEVGAVAPAHARDSGSLLRSLFGRRPLVEA